MSYKKKHGNLDVKVKEDKSLSNNYAMVSWSQTNPGKGRINLTDDHIASLDALGFERPIAEREDIALDFMIKR